MDPIALARAPFDAVGLAVRALDDLHALAERARREPDPVDEARARGPAEGQRARRRRRARVAEVGDRLDGHTARVTQRLSRGSS